MLNNDSGGSGGKYISIVGGKWTIRVPEGTEGAVERVNKNNERVSELQFTNLIGRFTGVNFKKASFGPVVELSMANDDTRDHGTISLGTGDQHLKTLMKMLPNIDRGKPVTLILVQDKEMTAKKGKPCHTLLAKQEGQWIKHYYKRGINGLPDAVEMHDGSLNYAEQDNFLFGVLKDYFNTPAAMAAPVQPAHEPHAPSASPTQSEPFEIDDDDIPF